MIVQITRSMFLYRDGVPIAIFSVLFSVMGFVLIYLLWKKTSRSEIIYILVGFTITSISNTIYQIIVISARYQNPDHVLRNNPHYLRGLLHIVTGFGGAGALLGLIGFPGLFCHVRDTIAKNRRTGRDAH